MHEESFSSQQLPSYSVANGLKKHDNSLVHPKTSSSSQILSESITFKQYSSQS